MRTWHCSLSLRFPWSGSQVRFINPTPGEHPERQEWLPYVFDPTERARIGLREREWQAIAPTEVEVMREMARCLREIAAGRVPK